MFPVNDFRERVFDHIVNEVQFLDIDLALSKLMRIFQVLGVLEAQLRRVD
jgi:hypothetical protein